MTIPPKATNGTAGADDGCGTPGTQKRNSNDKEARGGREAAREWRRVIYPVVCEKKDGIVVKGIEKAEGGRKKKVR